MYVSASSVTPTSKSGCLRQKPAIERAAEHGDIDAAVEAMQVYDMLHSDEGNGEATAEAA